MSMGCIDSGMLVEVLTEEMSRLVRRKVEEGVIKQGAVNRMQVYCPLLPSKNR